MLIEAKDLRGERKERLIDAVPLPAPWTMFIEPTNVCSFRCVYCPTGDTELLKQIGRKNTLMPYDMFVKIVDDMREFPRKLKQVNLYKDGESLIHPLFCNMVEYMRDADVAEKIWVKTNGQPLKPELNKRLVICGLDMIGISVPHVNERGIYAVTGVQVDYEKYRKNVLDLFQRSRGTSTQISTKIGDIGLSEADKQKFIDDFSDRCDFIAIEGLHGWSASDLGNWRLDTQNNFDGSPRTNKIACPLVLYMLTVSSNGDMSICNDDFGHWHNIGNAKDESLLDIWNGDRLREFRLMHLEGRREENRACGTCDYLQALPDSIDADLEVYKERTGNEN